jgi:RNA polymerase sigma-70 factor (ECF subfamily)
MAWLLTITRNLVRMKLRQSAKHAELDDAQWEAIPADIPTVTPEDRHLLQTALATLTDEDRQVVMLHSVTGLKHREIATLLAMPLATTLSKYHRA